MRMASTTTSNDIVDTAVALQLRDSMVLLCEQRNLIGVCADAPSGADTVMLGRTHGQAAVPITFGLKAAVWLDELRGNSFGLTKPRHVLRSGNSSAP